MCLAPTCLYPLLAISRHVPLESADSFLEELLPDLDQSISKLLDSLWWSLVSPPCSSNCAGSHSNPSCNHILPSWRSWTIRPNRLGYRYYLMLPVVTMTLVELKTREESVRKDKDRTDVCSHHMQNHSLLGGCIAFASIAPVFTFICTNAGETDSQSLMLPKWTDPWSLADLMLYCDD